MSRGPGATETPALDAPDRLTVRRMDRAFPIAIMAILVVIVALIAVPLGTLVVRAIGGIGSGGWAEILTQPWLPKVLLDTTIIVGVSGVLAVALALVLAWINTRSDAGVGVLGEVLPLLPLFIPAVAMAVGWLLLADPNVGFVNGFLQSIPGLGWITIDIFTFPGIIFAYVVTLLPYAYLPISSGLRSLDMAKEEAARISGAGTFRVIKDVVARAILPSVISGFTLVVIVGFALYSVPVILAPPAGVEILAVRIVRAMVGTYPAAYDVAIGLSTVLCVFLVALWLAQQRLVRKGRFATVGHRGEGTSVVRLGFWKIPARILLIGYIAVSSVLPLAALIVVSLQSFWTPNLLTATWTFSHYVAVFQNQTAQKALLYSGTVGPLVAAIALGVGVAVVIYQRMRNARLGKLVDGVSKAPAAISNTVFGLALIVAFGGSPLNLSGTIVLIAIGYLVVYPIRGD